MEFKNCHRTHNFSEITEKIVGEKIKVAGWIETIRDHGGLVFIDLRDHYGILQIVINEVSLADELSKETVISVEGFVRRRSEDNVNEKILTGMVEVVCEKLEVLGKCYENLPFEISSSKTVREDLRLKYRFLDLRNKLVHRNIVLRSKVISFMRKKMEELGFIEIQTPILSSCSPEGARDYVIPSRKFKGKFYALPQAPQIFKQLLMTSGFDRYFQIAPCFRDEDSRADRSPGEFYQLDFEMAFATQEDVLNVTENVMFELFTKFSNFKVSSPPFKRITFKEAMLKFGTDKPDLRNPLEIVDVSSLFKDSEFKPFSNKCVRAINVLDCASQPRSFFDKMLKYATSIGMKGLGYVKVDESLKFFGPIDKFLDDFQRQKLIEVANLKPGSVLFFIADVEQKACVFAGLIRTELAKILDLLEKDSFRFCYITDFPMFERDEETGQIIFTHNPFSMPQGGIKALKEKNPLEILAWQYDIVCNGVELSSGAVRNHSYEGLIKAFEIAGYEKDVVLEKFPSLCNAFLYGAPPHAGMAPGVDRILMMLCGEENIREVVAFPMNSNAQDLLLKSPSEITNTQLRELHIKIVEK